MRARTISLVLFPALLIAGLILYLHFPAARAQSGSSSYSPPAGSSGMSAAMHMPPPMPQSVYAGLWRVDHTFTASIHIKNTMVGSSVQVTPVLFMADGTEYDLSAINLGPNAVADVDVNRALANAPAEIAAHQSQYGSAELKYMNPGPGVVSGEITMIDAPRSLLYKSAFEMMMNSMNVGMSPSLQRVEGLWWRRDPSIGGFVDLANTTGNVMKVNVRVASAHGLRLPAQQVSLAPHVSQMLDLDQLTASLPGFESGQGGVRAEWSGYMGDIIIQGGLEGDREGYSTDLPFWSHNPPSSMNTMMAGGASQPAPSHQRTSSGQALAAVGIMTGFPAPAMNFPSWVRFTPYVILRNTTRRPMSLNPVLYLANTGQSQSFQLPNELLAPHEARQLDIAASLAKLHLQNFDGFINLTYSYQGAIGDVVMATGSVDQTGTYVFPSLPQAINSGWAKNIPGWTVANGYDSMYTLWNPSSQAEDLIMTFYFPNGKGSYVLPVHLGPYSSRDLDMAQLISLGEPDANGNTFPQGITEGSVMISGTQGMKQYIDVATNASEYSVANATCGGYCICCCGASVLICPFTVICPIGESQQLLAYVYCTDGTCENATGYADWSSVNDAVVTVETNEGSNPGLITGVGWSNNTYTCVDATVSGYPNPGQVCSCFPQCPPPGEPGGRAEVWVDGLSYSITSGGAPNDSSGVIAKQQFTVQIKAVNQQGSTDSSVYGNVDLTLLSINTALGESAPSSIYFTAGVTSANVTIVQAGGTESSPSSKRTLDVGFDSSQTDFQPWVYWQVTMDVERWKNCGFVSCPNSGSYYCTTSCQSGGFSSPTAFVAITESGLCGKGIVLEASGGGGWSSFNTTTIQDCGPAAGGGCSNPYWFTGNIPTMGGCLSDALATQLGIANGCNPGPYGQATVTWRFQQ